MMAKDISIILVNFKNRELTVNCINSILNSGISIEYEIVIVDNHSEDGSYDFLSESYRDFPDVRILETCYNGGFAYGNNYAISHSCGKYLFILNNDTVLYPGIVDALFETIKKDTNIGILGCKAVDKDGRELPTAQSFETILRIVLQIYIKPFTEKLGVQRWLVKNFTSPKKTENLIISDWIVGSAMMISRELYYRIGGLDENYFMYMEDEDLCRRLKRASFEIATLNRVGYIHYCGGSTIKSYFLTKECIKSKLLFFSRYESKSVCKLKKC